MCQPQVEEPDISDAALVRRARDGDADAGEMLFARHRPLLLRFFQRRLGKDAALDATQETLLRALARIDTLRCADRVRSWLFAFARYVLIEIRRARNPDGNDSELDELPACGTPESLLLRRELGDAVDGALAELRPERRAALLLYADDSSYCDIAHRLGWPRSKVRNEIHRARVELRHRLRAWKRRPWT
jgi:RNA polymerase sigma-70 factor (ECF subfamily)